MANCRFLFNNLFDTATISANSEADGYPVTELQVSGFRSTWRSTGITSEWVKWDLGANTALTDLIVKYHNFSAGATVKIQANLSATGDVWTTPDFEETLTVVNDQIVVKWSSNKTYRWWRLLIVDTGNSDGYIRIGKVYGGTHHEMSINFTFNFSDECIDPSTLSRSVGGTLYSTWSDPYSRWALLFENINATDYAALTEVFHDYLGQSIAYFICFNPSAETDETHYVENASPWAFQRTQYSNFYNFSLTIQEVRG